MNQLSRKQFLRYEKKDLSSRFATLISRCNGFLVGPSATRPENMITYFVAFTGMIGAGILFTLGEEFSFWKLFIICILAFDVFGGATANATNSARRWWHRPGVKRGSFIFFTLFHLHPIIIGALYSGFSFSLGVISYAGVICAAGICIFFPPSLTRPMAYGICYLLILFTAFMGGVAWYLSWFLPGYFMKLLLSHLLSDGAFSQE